MLTQFYSCNLLYHDTLYIGASCARGSTAAGQYFARFQQQLVGMDDIQAVLDRAHVAIDRANVLTSEAQTLQRAADRQQLHVRHALREAAALRAPPNAQAGRPESSTAQPAADSAEAILRRSAAMNAAPAQSTEPQPAHQALSDGLHPERPPSATSQRSNDGHVLAEAHAAIEAARASPASPRHAEHSGVAVITQQRAGSVAALAALRRRQLRLRACQMRALRCLLAAELQLAGFSVLVSCRVLCCWQMV